MKITLKREASTVHSTPGRIAVDGDFFWKDGKQVFSLEDTVREVPGRPVSEWKIDHETAIPAGTYKLGWTLSARFGRFTLQILNVPGFSGIRIHGGNDADDTEGCPMLGMVRINADRIRLCAPAVEALENKVRPLLEAGEEVLIEVLNP